MWRGYEVTGRDAHAWPELYFEGLGWVPFEPTPSRGFIPDYAQDDAAPAPAPEANPTGANQGASTAATTAPATTAGAASGADPGEINAACWLAGTGWVLLALSVLAIPAVVRWSLRQRRLAQVRTPGPGVFPAVVAWREVLATAVDHGYVVDPARTPALQAAAIAGFLGTTSPPGLELVLHSYERSVYGGAPAWAPASASASASARPGRGAGAGLEAGNGSGSEGLDASEELEKLAELEELVELEELAEAVEHLVARFQTSAPPWRRLRAMVAPASLLPTSSHKSSL